MNYPDVKTEVLSNDALAPIFRMQRCLYPDGSKAIWHSSPCYHSLLALKGCAVFREEGGAELRCEHTALLTIPNNLPYCWRMEGETMLFQCMYHPFNFVDHGALAGLFGSVSRHLALVKIPEDEFENFKRHMEIDISGPPDTMGLVLSTDFLRLMSVASSLSLEKSGHLYKHPALATAIAFLERNVSGEVSLAELAAVASLGTSRLSQLFREYTGKSPLQYFAMLKVRRALTMMQVDGLRACEVAKLLGFSSESYFRRFCKRQTGHSLGALLRK